MSLKEGIQRFLENIDPVILARGQDYYRLGRVENIDYDDSFVTAEVFGSEAEPYVVEIDFAKDGEVEDWNCDCPYNWGPVCKHTVAVLLALQAMPLEERSEKKNTIPIRELVEQAEKEKLVALILDYCRKDRRFKGWVLSELEDSGEQELVWVKGLVRASIRSYTETGYDYINKEDYSDIRASLKDALHKAYRRIERGQYDRALDIVEFVLHTEMKLIKETSDGFYFLSPLITAALKTVGLAAGSLVESGGDKGEWVGKLLEIAQDSMFDDWEDWRFDFLEQIAILADEQNEGEFYRILDCLNDRRWEKFRDTPAYIEQEKLFRYRLVGAVHGQQEARAYLEQNLDVDGLRLILVRENMEERNYANAERLCWERVDKEEMEQRYSSSQWQKLLYEIYRDGEQKEKQIQQARKLALLRNKDFYQVTKGLLMEAGRWEEEYPSFLAELEDKWLALDYMDVLAQENETAMLMEQVRVHRDEVFRYGNVLAPQYSEEVYSLCTTAIRQAAEHINNRKDYQRLCGLLQSLVNFGGMAEAQTLIDELRQAYPHRPALWDELGEVERKIKKKPKI